MPESIAANIPLLDVESWTEHFGITESEAQQATEKWWKWKFNKAKNELDAQRKNATLNAWREKNLKCPLGEEVARFSGREYYWLKEQYGPGFDQDLDFLLCYQKYSGQKEFLAAPSKDVFN